jgi:hemolysin activation/secretion protein
VSANPGLWGKVFALLDHYYTFSNPRFSLETLAQGQGAFNNLDAYEAISLGWPNAVRAYSPGSNLGDSGLTLQNTLRYQLFPRLSLRAYVDAGCAWTFVNALSSTSTPNYYNLWGPGIGLDLGIRGNLLFSVDLAFQGSSIPGEGAGGSSYPAQLWLSVKKWL